MRPSQKCGAFPIRLLFRTALGLIGHLLANPTISPHPIPLPIRMRQM
jgi:hypothetical protein